MSASLPIPLIEVKRIKYRHEDELFKIEGVHAVGIAESGIFVSILPEKNANKRSIPTSIEGIPVIIRESGVAMKESHWDSWYRPLPVGAHIDSPYTNGGGDGSVGPHVSRDLSDGIGYCCQLYSLTAGHVIHYTYQSPSLAWNSTIVQGLQFYGTVAWVFQETPCPPGGYNACYNAVNNDTRIRPDAAAIGHSGADYYPMASPCSGVNKPVRRMQSNTNSWVHGPTGIIRIPLFSNCSGSSCLKNWGAFSHQPTGGLIGTEVTEFLFDASGTWYKEGPLDNASYNSTGGDSGGLIAWNGQRDLAGLHEARSLDFPYYRAYIRLDYIQTAFYNAGASFDHYWGTASGKLRPSATAQDNPC